MQKYTRNVKFNIMLMKNQQSIPQLIGRHRVKVPIRIVNHSNFNSTHDIFRSEYEITEKKEEGTVMYSGHMPESWCSHSERSIFTEYSEMVNV